MAADVRDIEALIARAGLGNRAAFADLYDATSAKLFGVCLRVLGSRAEAEEALQEAYVKVWNSAGRYRAGVASPMSWLISIARNQAIDLRRARRAPTETIDDALDIAAPGPNPEQQAMASAEGRRLQVCLDRLPADRARAVQAAYVEGYSYEELATRFAVPLNTMRTWLRRALISLRECLGS
jgi:RNA polymerase sigma-70 factor (ECF subfamily)